MLFSIFLYFQDQRTMARFIMYAMCAADEALKDANWIPVEVEKKERTVFQSVYGHFWLLHESWLVFSESVWPDIFQGVSIGGGIGSICDIVDAAKLICEKVGQASS